MIVEFKFKLVKLALVISTRCLITIAFSMLNVKDLALVNREGSLYFEYRDSLYKPNYTVHCTANDRFYILIRKTTNKGGINEACTLSNACLIFIEIYFKCNDLGQLNVDLARTFK